MNMKESPFSSGKIIMGIMNASYRSENSSSLSLLCWLLDASCALTFYGSVEPFGSAHSFLLTSALLLV